VKIARMILELNKSKGELYNGNPWQNHRLAIAKTFRYNPAGYKARVKNLLEVASANECQMAILPACAIITSSEADLAHYRGSASIVPWVASGVLASAAGKQHQETACLLRSGRPVLQFDSSRPVQAQVDKAWAFLAISSTVAKIKSTTETPPATTTSVVVLDLGHHQYNGRYMMTLRSVKADLEKRFALPPTVLLSFWRFREGKVASAWAAGNSRLRFKRIEIANDGSLDYVDIFSI
jgi:hypothetical protein